MVFTAICPLQCPFILLSPEVCENNVSHYQSCFNKQNYFNFSDNMQHKYQVYIKQISCLYQGYKVSP